MKLFRRDVKLLERAGARVLEIEEGLDTNTMLRLLSSVVLWFAFFLVFSFLWVLVFIYL